MTEPSMRHHPMRIIDTTRGAYESGRVVDVLLVELGRPNEVVFRAFNLDTLEEFSRDAVGRLVQAVRGGA
jgi:hypothetical protein